MGLIYEKVLTFLLAGEVRCGSMTRNCFNPLIAWHRDMKMDGEDRDLKKQ